jgi:hypothetical protein
VLYIPDGTVHLYLGQNCEILVKSTSIAYVELLHVMETKLTSPCTHLRLNVEAPITNAASSCQLYTNSITVTIVGNLIIFSLKQDLPVSINNIQA